jgi:hypothetical protein
MGLESHKSGQGSQVPFEFLESLLCLLGLLKFVLLLEQLEEREPPLTTSLELNLLRAAMHPRSFCTSCRLSDGLIFMVADIFFGLGSILWWETIYPSSFPDVTPTFYKNKILST